MRDMKVRDVMTNLVVLLYPEDTIHEAARRLAQNRISGAPVVQNGKLVGVISESDLLRAATPPAAVDPGMSVLDMLGIMARLRPRETAPMLVKDVMTTHSFRTHPEASIWDAAAELDRYGIKRLPVVDEEGLVLGIVSRADVIRAMARSDEQIRGDVLDIVESIGSENYPDLDVLIVDGVLTLSGEADRRSSKDILMRLVARVPGVVEVKDRMLFKFDDVREARSHLSSAVVGPAV